jgi:hypothetical protein
LAVNSGRTLCASVTSLVLSIFCVTSERAERDPDVAEKARVEEAMANIAQAMRPERRIDFMRGLLVAAYSGLYIVVHADGQWAGSFVIFSLCFARNGRAGQRGAAQCNSIPACRLLS